MSRCNRDSRDYMRLRYGRRVSVLLDYFTRPFCGVICMWVRQSTFPLREVVELKDIVASHLADTPFCYFYARYVMMFAPLPFLLSNPTCNAQPAHRPALLP